MGNKCCSKRQDPDIGPGGKKNDLSGISQQKYTNGSIDRYTPDPNRGVKVDFIRHRQPTRKHHPLSQFDFYFPVSNSPVLFKQNFSNSFEYRSIIVFRFCRSYETASGDCIVQLHGT